MEDGTNEKGAGLVFGDSVGLRDWGKTRGERGETLETFRSSTYTRRQQRNDFEL